MHPQTFLQQFSQLRARSAAFNPPSCIPSHDEAQPSWKSLPGKQKTEQIVQHRERYRASRTEKTFMPRRETPLPNLKISYKRWPQRYGLTQQENLCVSISEELGCWFEIDAFLPKQRQEISSHREENLMFVPFSKSFQWKN